MAKKKRKTTRREKEAKGMTPPEGKSRYAMKATRDADTKQAADMARSSSIGFGRFED